jgi:hypothetical protein
MVHLLSPFNGVFGHASRGPIVNGARSSSLNRCRLGTATSSVLRPSCNGGSLEASLLEDPFRPTYVELQKPLRGGRWASQLTETERLAGVNFYVMHPVLCMESRVHNVVGLPHAYDRRENSWRHASGDGCEDDAERRDGGANALLRPGWRSP